jgi:cation diffusion facilitator CzcD-associated flavoprotein CzcO
VRTLREPVLVVGAGHSGLSVAAALTRRGVPSLVLDRADQVGAAWRDRYGALRLNTERWGSALPGRRIPRGPERWPSAADFAAYLQEYADAYGIRRRHGVEVRRVDEDPTGGYRLDTSAGDLHAPAVVVAAGPDREPRPPDWPGIVDFGGTVLHTADYREPGPFAGRSVLVVGGGESGADVALDLARGGAAKVWLSVRTPPYLVAPSFLGIPSQRLAILARGQPPRLFDLNAELMRRHAFGDLSRLGLHRPPSLHASARVAGRAPVLDRGIVDAVRRGEVEVVPAVVALDRTGAELAGGRRVEPEAVIAATGHHPGLDAMVGHLGVLDGRGRPRVDAPATVPEHPLLFFAGYAPVLTGAIREAGRIARRTARVLDRRLRTTTAANAAAAAARRVHLS